MPMLHSLCAKPATYFPTTTGHPTTIQSPPLQRTITVRGLSLPLPELPLATKEKILSLELMGIDSGRALCLNPALRDATPDSIHAVITFLQSKGIHFKDLTRILGMCPSVLTSSVRSDLAPVFTFLSKDLGVPDSNYRRVINKCPRILACSVRDQLMPALIYLRRLGFKDTAALAYNDTVLLVSSVENTLIPKLQYLMSLGMSKQEAVGMALRCPALFTFSIEKNFKPKYEYFVEAMGGILEEIKEFPQYFAFSLEKRIRPRHLEVIRSGLVKLPLPELLKTTDEEFQRLLQQKRSGTSLASSLVSLSAD